MRSCKVTAPTNRQRDGTEANPEMANTCYASKKA